MKTEIGRVEAFFRYPVKSMAGEPLETAELGWHGLEGDRRLALRRVGDHGTFPFLTAGKLPRLLLYKPVRQGGGQAELPTHVRTPEGRELAIFSDELAEEIGRASGVDVQMMSFRNGIFDEGSVSVIASDTIREISRHAEQTPDVRRFRPNILVNALQPLALQEDAWVGGALTFGDGPDAPSMAVTLRDLRCAMLNIDPDTAALATSMMKTVVRMNDNNAGIYGTVTRTGRVSVGQRIYFYPAAVRKESAATTFGN